MVPLQLIRFYVNVMQPIVMIQLHSGQGLADAFRSIQVPVMENESTHQKSKSRRQKRPN